MKAARPKNSLRRGSIIVISAPSGAGKSTLIRRLMDSLSGFKFSVSTTTRPRRRGEKNGRDYIFVSRQRFKRMIAASQFVEWADVFGNLYGTCAADTERVLESGSDLVLVIDVQGVGYEVMAPLGTLGRAPREGTAFRDTA